MKIKNFLVMALALVFCVGSIPVFAEEANPIVIDGKKFVIAQDAWNVDFEGEHVGSHRWGGAYVEIKNTVTSATLTNSLGNSLVAHMGSTSNAITTEDTGDTERANAMKLAASDGSQVQLNEFAATASGDVVAYEWDWKLSKKPQNTSAVIVVMQPVVMADSWLDSLKAVADSSDSTKLKFNVGDKFKPLQPGNWYSIRCYVNYTDRTISYYIDGELFSKSAIASAAQNKGKKIIAKLGDAAGGEMWIDNFRHYSLNAIPEISSVSTDGKYIDISLTKAVSIDNFIDGEAVSNISVVNGKKNIVLVGAEPTSDEKTYRFEAASAIPTAVPLDITIDYMGISIKATFESSPANIDFKNVTIAKNGDTFVASAKGHNPLGSEQYATMIMALYDAKGAVVAVKYGTEQLVADGTEVTISAASAQAVSAKLFFMNSWADGRPFKNIYYLYE